MCWPGGAEDGGRPRERTINGTDRSEVWQEAVTELFDAEAEHWRRVYDTEELDGAIFRVRHERALAWVDGIELAEGARVIDVGCGAGLLTVDLARRGHRVVAVDGSLGMLSMTGAHARASGVGREVSLSLDDVHALGCRTGAASLVTALGVVPWLRSPATALRELARVVGPGGYLLVTSDNSLRLVHLVDPRYNPAVLPVLRAVKRLGVATGLLAGLERDVGERRYRPRKLDRLLAEAGLRKVRECSVGFGRFTFLGRPILPERWGQALNRRLQQLADRDVALVRHLGNHTMILARKPL